MLVVRKPEFLEKDEGQWPKFTIGELNPEDIEIKKKPFFTMVITTHDSEQIDFKNVSDKKMLVSRRRIDRAASLPLMI